jgi:integrase/recombinase XerD
LKIGGQSRLRQEHPINDEAVSPLRRRTIEDMTIRHFAARTQTDYIRTVRTFAAFLGQSLDQAEPEDLRRFQSLRVRMASSHGRL